MSRLYRLSSASVPSLPFPSLVCFFQLHFCAYHPFFLILFFCSSILVDILRYVLLRFVAVRIVFVVLLFFCLFFCLVQNPNYTPATLKGVLMTMLHQDMAGQEAPFGYVTFTGEHPAKLPARGSAIVQAEVGMYSMMLGQCMYYTCDRACRAVQVYVVGMVYGCCVYCRRCFFFEGVCVKCRRALLYRCGDGRLLPPDWQQERICNVRYQHVPTERSGSAKCLS